MKNIIQAFGRHSERSVGGRYFNRQSHIIISSEEFSRMYKKNPSSVSGAELIIPKLGGGVLPQYKIPTNVDFIDLTETIAYESAE